MSGNPRLRCYKKTMYKIYSILDKCNGKKYIGMTSRSVAQRFKEHCYAKNRYISQMIRIKGSDNFSCSEIASTDKYEIASFLEKENIIKQNTMFPFGYNKRCDGDAVNFLITKYTGKQNELF